MKFTTKREKLMTLYGPLGNKKRNKREEGFNARSEYPNNIHNNLNKRDR
jgi:hypothetical protein